MKTKPADPQLAEWCAALVPPPNIEEVPDGWLTVVQLSEKLGKPRQTVNRWVADAVASGAIEMRKFRVVAGNRGTYPTPHYRVVK